MCKPTENEASASTLCRLGTNTHTYTDSALEQVQAQITLQSEMNSSKYLFIWMGSTRSIDELLFVYVGPSLTDIELQLHDIALLFHSNFAP